MDKQTETMVDNKHFWCSECSHYWNTNDFSEPSHASIDLPDTGADDPLNYYSRCPLCHDWARAVPHYYANLKKMHPTGPRTEAGKRRSSLNGMTHGLYAQQKNLLAPAHGKYSICESCDEAERCRDGALKYCPYRVDNMLRFVAAYENGDVEAMRTFAGLTHARMADMLTRSMDAVDKTGTELIAPKVYKGVIVSYEDEDGKEHIVMEHTAHPLITKIIDMMAAMGLTSDQMKINPSKTESDPNPEGNLKAPADPISFMNEMKEMVKIVTQGGIDIAKAMRGEDPDSESESGDDADVEFPDEPNPFPNSIKP